MKKNYRVVIAFILTILMVLGSGAFAFAAVEGDELGEEIEKLTEGIQPGSEDPQPDGEDPQPDGEDPKPDGEDPQSDGDNPQPEGDRPMLRTFAPQSVNGNTSVHLLNSSKETITSVVVYFGSDTIILTETNSHNWDGSDSKEFVLGGLTKVVVNFSEYGEMTYEGSDLGPQGKGTEEPMEYSAEGSGTINLWLNEILTLEPEITLNKTVDQSAVSTKSAVVTYTFTVTNSGDTDLKAVNLQDPLIGLNIQIGKLAKGAVYTTEASFNLGNLSEQNWQNNVFTNTASTSGKYGKDTVSATDDADVTYNPEYIAPGSIEIFKQINGTDAIDDFDVTVYDEENEIVTTGSISAEKSFFIGNLDPGYYVVEEAAAIGYKSDAPTKAAIVTSGNTTNVTFVNTFITTKGPGLQLIKDVSPSTVTIRSASVTYTFAVKNIGDEDLFGVFLEDKDIGYSLEIGDLNEGETTTASISFNLSNLGTLTYGDWVGDIFTNIATVTGFYGNPEYIGDGGYEGPYVTATDSAIVTYSEGTTTTTTTTTGRNRTATTTIADDAIPAASIPAAPIAEEIPILEEEIPEAPLPLTGGVPAMLLFGLGSLLAGAGALLRRKEK